jgi:hypothetical protein
MKKETVKLVVTCSKRNKKTANIVTWFAVRKVVNHLIDADFACINTDVVMRKGTVIELPKNSFKLVPFNIKIKGKVVVMNKIKLV